MVASLTTLPFDIILLILELGGLETMDAVALCLVCKALYHASEHRSFWLVVANKVQRRHPLPLPSFRTLATLSKDEIRRACVLNATTLNNLKSSQPQCRGSRILIMENNRSQIKSFAFLHGGRYGLISQSSGFVSIWDLHAVVDEKLGAASAHDALPDMDYAPTPVGKMLAGFETGTQVQTLQYRTFGPEERQVVVTTISNTLWTGRNCMSVFEFNFISDDEVILHQHYQTTRILATQAALGPYGSVTFFGCQDTDDDSDDDNSDDDDPDDDFDDASPLLLVVDFVQGHEVLIHTREMPETNSSYDLVATDAGDLLVYKVTRGALEVFIYFDIRDLLSTNSETIRLAPHAKRVIEYSVTCQFLDQSNRKVQHPCNTPNVRTLHHLPLMTSLMPLPSNFNNATQRIFAFHWLNTDHLVAQLKSDRSSRFPEPIHRTFCQVELQIYSALNPQSLFAFGDSGRNAIWIRAPPMEGGPRSLQLLPVQSPVDDPTPETGLSLQENLRTLQLPIALTSVTQLAFCDELGILMVAIGRRRPTRLPEQRIHFFQY